MRYVYWGLALFLALIIQSRLSLLGVSPNLTVLLAYFAGIRYGNTKGLFIGALIGAIEDSVSSSFLGPHMLSKGIVGYAASFMISGGFFRWTPVLGMILLSVLTLTDNAIGFISRTLFDKMPDALSTMFFISIMQSLLNAPAGIFLRPSDEE
ncbi:MAG: rod shape-determining protein MreD [Nitrospiraceae bacterium]|nr:MAG: rod shape-determining protein MreD [Nitrospiraceae bacterium]